MIDLECHWTTETINTWVRENPPRTYAPERSLKKMVSAFVSQSLPPPSFDALASCNFKLADFSSGTSDEMRNSITVCNLYSYITFSSIFIRSNHRRYHASRLTAPWSHARRRVGWICRHLDLRLSGELFLVCRATYLNYGCARCSRCLPVNPFLNQWHRLNMMLRKPTYCFIKWSFFLASS